MKQIRTVDDIKQLGSILSVWAHPDDESFSCGGIMAAAVANGQPTMCVTATKGEAGVQDESRWPAAELGDIRAHELVEALHCLGCKYHAWLGYPDGGCADVSDAEGATQIKKFIDKHQPDTILTFGPDGMTGHPDHQAVSRWVSRAVTGTGITVYHRVDETTMYEKHIKKADEIINIYFNIDKPITRPESECDISFLMPKNIADRKFAALKAMPSQTEAMFKHLPEECYEAFYLETFVKATR